MGEKVAKHYSSLIHLILVLLLLPTISFFTACANNNEFNATITCTRYTELNGLLKNDFLQDNRLYGAYYNIAENEGEENYEKFIGNSPSLRSILIKTQTEYDDIFIGQPITVNFENQMLAVCSWSWPRNDTEYGKTSISEMRIVELNEGTPNYSNSLLIKFKRDFSKNENEADIFVQEYAFVVLDKINVDGVHFSVG